MNVKILLRFSVPVGLLALFWLTMRVVASYSDESMISYGFPFSWYAPSGVSSMAYDLAVGPFIVDSIFYIGTCHGIILLVVSKSALSHKLSNVVSTLLWFAALSSLGLMFIAVSMEPHFVGWTLDSYFAGNAQRNYSFHFGP